MNLTSPDENSGQAVKYRGKPTQYFSGSRTSFIDPLPYNPTARLLEVGCGNGDTAAYAKRTGKCGWCTGIELCSDPAVIAKSKLDHVIIADLEVLNFPIDERSFDILVLSEVIEHLRDPWVALSKLHTALSPGASVIAGSPNVAHHSVLRMLLRGRWDYTPMGVMDRTHLRWFTPQTYQQLFEDCGYSVKFVGPSRPLHTKASVFNRITLRRFQHLLHTQIMLRAYRQ